MPADAAKKPIRGRPRDANREEAIIAAGFEEFAEKGFLAARLEDVAARAGVAKGTVYLYFDSKDALFQAAVRARIVPLVTEVQVLSTNVDGSTIDILRQALTAVYARLSHPDVRTLLRILIAEGQRFPDLLTFYHQEMIAKMMPVLSAIMQRGITRGDFEAGPLTRLPIVLLAPALMGAIWQMTFAAERDVPMADFHDAHLDLLTRALSPHQHR